MGISTIPGKARLITPCVILILVSPLGGLCQGKPDAPALPVYEDWVSLSTEDGLIDDHACWVKVDTVHSCVWAGTDNGLACYLDGRWKVYTPKDGRDGRGCGSPDRGRLGGHLRGAEPSVRNVDWQGDDVVWVATAHGISRGTRRPAGIAQ